MIQVRALLETTDYNYTEISILTGVSEYDVMKADGFFN